MDQQTSFILGAVVAAIIFFIGVGWILARLYARASKEISYVRTGMGGQKVIMNGGSLVFPVLHEIIPVNMNTLRLDVRRNQGQALITRDRMRVDVAAEFYVRVQPSSESIAAAAQTLGRKTIQPEALKDLVEGKFVDALRSVAAEMAMEELHEQRTNFVQKVQQVSAEDLLKNGLELESVSLTGLDQTSKEYFNPDNAFDAEGLTKLTEAIEARRKKRNDIEQETEVLIERKNLEAEQQKLEIGREEEYAKLAQEREIEVRRASQQAEIAREQAEKRRDAERAQIGSQQEIDQSAIEAERVVEEQRIEKERQLKERDIDRDRSVELAEQDRQIAVAEKSKAQSEAQRQADLARAEAATAAESIETSRQAEIAEREKRIELIEAAKEAERRKIELTVAAEAEKLSSEDHAEAIKIQAQAAAEKARLHAEGDAEAERLRASGLAERYRVEAEGKQSINEASNTLSAEQIAMQVKLAIVAALPEIIRESAKPMEQIDGIKIVQVEGLRGDGHGGGAGAAADGDGQSTRGDGSLADQVVASALRYRAQAPLVDSILSEVGLSGKDLDGLSDITKD